MKFEHYLLKFQLEELGISDNIPIDDIGISFLFHTIHRRFCRYVMETNCYFVYDGTRWVKDMKNMKTMEFAKVFTHALCYYAEGNRLDSLEKLGNQLKKLRNRETLLRDVSSVEPLPFSTFDQNPYLFNCKNVTFHLDKGEYWTHDPDDFITKIANVTYKKDARCDRWESFIEEIMKNEANSMNFLQKTFGYTLSGETSQECFFIFYGSTSRNGKSTCCETVSHLMGDYASNVQPETLAKTNKNGSTASPDVARLQGIRLVVTPEPEKGLELNASLMKQLTGGDKLTSRFLNENPIEFTPEFKIVMNTNHQPRISDDTVFSSQRVKLIPFERHFTEEEQDKTLKTFFKDPENLSGILNWMLRGYELMKVEGLEQTGKLFEAVDEYREESDIFGNFVHDCLRVSENNRLPTKRIYEVYQNWARECGYRPMNMKNMTQELKKRYDIRRDSLGNNLINFDLTSEYS